MGRFNILDVTGGREDASGDSGMHDCNLLRKEQIPRFDCLPQAAPGMTLARSERAEGRNENARGPVCSVKGSSLALHVVHQEVLTEIVRGGEVGFAFAHLSNLLNELNEAVVGGEHEGVDHDASAPAFVNFLERFTDDEGI